MLPVFARFELVSSSESINEITKEGCDLGRAAGRVVGATAGAESEAGSAAPVPY